MFGLWVSNDKWLYKRSKFHAQQQLKHPGFVGKERSYFKKKGKLRNKNAPKLLEFYINRASERSIKALRADYPFREFFAEAGKSHTIAERLVKPTMLVYARELLEGANLQQILLLNDVVRKRQCEMTKSLEELLVEKLKVSKFSLQINETTINNSVL